MCYEFGTACIMTRDDIIICMQIMFAPWLGNIFDMLLALECKMNLKLEVAKNVIS